MGKFLVRKLKDSEQEGWNNFVDSSPQGSIFCKTWWLDVVSHRYEIIVCTVGDRIIGGMPITYRKAFGIWVNAMPPLTQTMGVLFEPINAKYVKRLSKEKEITLSIVNNLPHSIHFSQNFHYNFTNWLPFYWKNFKTTVRYTYVFEDLSNLNSIWEGFRENIKTDIRKAEKQGIQIKGDLELNKFLEISEKTFNRQKTKFPFKRALVIKLDQELLKRNSRKIFYAIDNEANIHAAVYLVWDKNSAYYLMGASDPVYRNSGANSLALWKAIEFSSRVTKKFDFEGSMIAPVENFFRSFGAIQKPYFRIWRNSSFLVDLYMLFTKRF